jgi:hypothetical protein
MNGRLTLLLSRRVSRMCRVASDLPRKSERTSQMSKHINMTGHYHVAGRDRQGEGILQASQKGAYAQQRHEARLQAIEAQAGPPAWETTPPNLEIPETPAKRTRKAQSKQRKTRRTRSGKRAQPAKQTRKAAPRQKTAPRRKAAPRKAAPKRKAARATSRQRTS